MHASSALLCPVLRVSCTPGAGSSSIIPTFTLSFRAVDSQRTATPGSPHEPTSPCPSKPCRPCTAPSSQKKCAPSRLLEQSDPQVWQMPWNVHSQANPQGATALKYLAPYVFKVAISNRRIVSLKDRTVTFTYRKPGSVRPRTAQLDVLEFMRRFLQHVLPSGFMKVRHFGFLSTSCAITPADIRRMMPEQNGSASAVAASQQPSCCGVVLPPLWWGVACRLSGVAFAGGVARYRVSSALRHMTPLYHSALARERDPCVRGAASGVSGWGRAGTSRMHMASKTWRDAPQAPTMTPPNANHHGSDLTRHALL